MKLIYKIIYSPGINFLLRNLLKPIGKLRQKPLLSVSGKLRLSINNKSFVLLTNQTCSVTQDLFFNGVEQYEFTPLFKDIIANSKVFFDVGANIGLFSVLAEKLNPEVKILAFEPSKGPLNFLTKNVAENKLKNVTIVDKAVAELDGELTFYDVVNSKYAWVKHNLNGSNSLQNKFGREKGISYPVKTITLQRCMDDFKLSGVDLIKLDTECTEHLIIENSLGVIGQYKPIIICEVYPEISQEMERLISSLQGYHIYQYLEHQLVKISTFDEVSGSKERNFVFVHQERYALIQKWVK